MRAALPPNGPDVVIDCAGFEPTLQAGLATVSLASHEHNTIWFLQ